MRVLLIIGLLIFTAWMITFPMASSESKNLVSVKIFCPVSGKPVDQNVYADYSGQRVFFFSEADKEQFLKNPEPYLEELKKQATSISAKSRKKNSDCNT
ncbi:MAG: hypothetical protein KJ645_12910 [Planctomycetes bacterium]|nr:hypothetical protein [Planctomycetota bacterium]